MPEIDIRTQPKSPKVHQSSVLGISVKCGPGVEIGPNCFLDGDITLGEGVRMIGGVTLVGAAEIGTYCIFEPNVSFSRTRANAAIPNDGLIVVGPNTFIGAGSVISEGVKIGSNVRIAVGSFVSQDVPSYAIVGGNPAQISGYDEELRRESRSYDVGAVACRQSHVEGVRFCDFPVVSDARGDLCVSTFDSTFPFIPKRCFTVYNVPPAAHRGEHAHYKCEEILVCLKGSLTVVVDDGKRREEILIDSPSIGLYLAPSVWRRQYRYALGSVCLVFASTLFEPSDYIRDYNVFVAEYESKR